MAKRIVVLQLKYSNVVSDLPAKIKINKWLNYIFTKVKIEIKRMLLLFFVDLTNHLLFKKKNNSDTLFAWKYN